EVHGKRTPPEFGELRPWTVRMSLNRATGPRESTARSRRIPESAVEPLRRAGAWNRKRNRVGRQRVGAEGGPVRKVWRGLNHVALARLALEPEFNLSA